MRNIVALLFVLASTHAVGQTNAGSFLLGGTMGYEYSFSKAFGSDYTSVSLNLSPTIGYFVADRFAVGVVTPYISYSEGSGSPILQSWSYTVGPMVRYYIGKGALYFFPELSYSWGWGASRQLPNGYYDWQYSSSKTFNRGGGAAYFLSKNVGIEGKITYQSVYADYNNTFPFYDFNTSEWSFQIGVQVYFDPRKK